MILVRLTTPQRRIMASNADIEFNGLYSQDDTFLDDDD